MNGRRSDDDDDSRHDGMTLPIARALETIAAQLRAAQARLDEEAVRASAPIKVTAKGRGLALTLVVTPEDPASRLEAAARAADRAAAALVNDKPLSIISRKPRRNNRR